MLRRQDDRFKVVSCLFPGKIAGYHGVSLAISWILLQTAHCSENLFCGDGAMTCVGVLVVLVKFVLSGVVFHYWR